MNTQKKNIKSTEMHKKKNTKAKKEVVGMDCEMVGTGWNGKKLIAARVSIVGENGATLLDTYIKPSRPVTNYKTEISGIRPHNLKNASEFSYVANQVKNLLRNKILVGHSVYNDLTALNITHPRELIRDTSQYMPLRELVCFRQTPSLKLLSQVLLKRTIQTGEHDSVEDARAALDVYLRYRDSWEKSIKG